MRTVIKREFGQNMDAKELRYLGVTAKGFKNEKKI